MKNHLFTLLFIVKILTLSAQNTAEMPLYEGEIPNAKTAENLEKITLRDGMFRIEAVSKPTLTRFNPVHPNGKSVIICPGGGYSILASAHEGVDVARCTNTSLPPPSGEIKPKPFAWLKNFTVPF